MEGVEAGRRVAAYRIDPDSGARPGLVATAGVGEGGWVYPADPILVRAGEAFIPVPVREKNDSQLVNHVMRT